MMKYIRFEDQGLVIFEERLRHSDVADKFAPDKPLSAGSVAGDDLNEPRCLGESATLKLVSNPEDTALLRRRLEFL